MTKLDWRLSHRIAREAQLLAEEKWIIDALKKVKQQRNCLQIERLHLENLKATVDNKDMRRQLSAASAAEFAAQASGSQTIEEPVSLTPETVVIQTMLSRLDGPVAGIDDDMCNKEELNLSVTNSVFTNKQLNTYDAEEDEEDNVFEEEEDMENALIEMNMLMNVRDTKGG